MSKLERFNKLLERIDEDEFKQYFYSIHLVSEFTEKFNINTNAYYKLVKYFELRLSDDDKLKLEEKRLNKIKQTNLEKYGCENVFQSAEIKDKIKKTCLEHYGVEYSLQASEVKEKAKQTCLNKYGVDNPAKSAIIQDKIKQTNLERYGTESPLQADSIKEKIKQTNSAIYGNSYISRSDYWHEVVSKTNLEKYKVPWACMRKEARVKGNNSSVNQIFSDLLKSTFDDYNEKTDREFSLDNYSFDFKYHNYLIEIDPAATHNSTFGIYNTVPKTKFYHQEKSLCAIKHGFHCIHVWDWDNIDLILNLLNNNKTKIYARKCQIKVINDLKVINKFLNNYHLQGTCKNQIICLGLYYNDELIQIMTFGKPRYNKNYEYELLRLCTKSDYLIIGGAKKLFKYFIENYNPKSIISYCDNSKFSGDIYIKLGFKLKSYGTPSKHWYNMNTKQHITDNLLRQRGFDQLFKTDYGKGTSNEELMLNAKFVEIYDCGQSTYIYNR